MQFQKVIKFTLNSIDCLLFPMKRRSSLFFFPTGGDRSPQQEKRGHCGYHGPRPNSISQLASPRALVGPGPKASRPRNAWSILPSARAPLISDASPGHRLSRMPRHPDASPGRCSSQMPPHLDASFPDRQFHQTKLPIIPS